MPDAQGKKNILIICVVACVLPFIILWLWSWKKNIEEFSWRDSSEGKLASEMADQWRQANETKKRLEEERQTVRDAMNRLFSNTAASGQSATGSPADNAAAATSSAP